MRKAEELLRPGFTRRTTVERAGADGFYAETGAEGELRHFGLYRAGEAQGWVIDVGPGGEMRASRTALRTAEAGDDEWLREMVETIYRDAEAEHTTCSFCEKRRSEVATLIAGPDRYTYICDECVDTCAGIVAGAREGSA
jgi:hypothetical protein